MTSKNQSESRSFEIIIQENELYAGQIDAAQELMNIIKSHGVGGEAETIYIYLV